MIGAFAAGFTGTYPRVARATQARALSLGELLQKSRHALLATPVEMACQWETVGGHRRIVTYSTIQVHRALDGRSPSDGDLAVRTLGGRVGDIGQIVHGEAILRVGKASALFLQDIAPSVYSVTALAQGHFPLSPDRDGQNRLVRGAKLGELVGVEGSAVRLLHGRLIPEAERLIGEELHRNDP